MSEKKKNKPEQESLQKEPEAENNDKEGVVEVSKDDNEQGRKYNFKMRFFLGDKL